MMRCAARSRRGFETTRTLLLAVAVCLAGLLLPADAARAQDGAADDTAAQPGRFRLYRWQEDYLWLSRKTEALSDYERVKYIHLGGALENYLSFGGEARYRLDRYDSYLFGLTANGKPFNSNQERTLVHADLHLTQYFRTFVQLDAAWESGRPVQRAYDQSEPDLRQAFGDLILPAGSGIATMRVGRQELWLGPSRWLAVRDPTNIRRSFDGALMEYRDESLIVRGFAARPVLIGPGAFDDSTTTSELFRGIYATVKRPLSLPVSLDAYLLGKELDSVTYTRGTGREDRWTTGTRAAGKIIMLDYVVEGAYQFGTFGNADISAFGFFGDISKTFEIAGLMPRVGLRGHYASGDRALNDSTLRTFSAPYPAASVIAEMSLLSVSNTVNLQPYVQLMLPTGLALGASWNVVRRATAADAVYGPIGTLIKAPTSQAMDVARIAQFDLTWDITRFVQLHALYSRIFAGGYIQDAKGHDFDYYRFQVMARF